MYKLIRELSLLRGISGCEKRVSCRLRELMEPLCDRIESDNMGNLICFKAGRDHSKKVLVAAHMDEVGLIISYITEDGLLRFHTVGGIDARVLIGRRVLVGSGGVVGVISTKAVHLATADERAKAPDSAALFIDIGAATKKEAQKAVSLGDMATFYTECEQLSDDLVCGKALDNRIGCAAVVCAAKKQPRYDSYFAFTVQEEVGLRGAFAAVYGTAPDIAIIVDTTTAADIPAVPQHKQACRVGEGTVLFIIEGFALYTRASYEKSKRCAELADVRFQLKDLVSGGLDAGAIQRSCGGTEVISIATPCRYLHSPACVASISDAEQTAKLLSALLEYEGLFGESDG